MSLRAVLDVREGEGRVALVLFGHLFFVTAAAIVLSAAKNGLFLSAYPAELIPHVIVAAAITTAVAATLFTGFTGRLTRRVLLEGTVGVAAVSLVVARSAFLADARWAFALYLWLSILGALVIALAWGSVGDLLTGRQSRRLMPLLIAGTSVAGMTAGFGLGPAAERFGTPDLLLGAALALVLGAAVLRLGPGAASAITPGDAAFLERVRRGATLIRRHRLLGLLAGGVVVSAALATLVDYQFKAVLQESYDRDAITSLFGMLAGAVGFGTLLFQALASRVLFRRWGLVSGSYVQATLVGAAAGLVALTGWLAALAALRFVDEAGRFTLQKSVEQVSVAPYPAATRRAALTVLGGVLKPLATAFTGVILMALAPALGLRGLAALTALAALGLFVLFRRHPALYREALEDALATHRLRLADVEGVPAVLDRSALEVVDRALVRDDDPALLIFTVSLLRRAPRAEAVPRLAPLLDHPVAEVRAETATGVLEALDGADDPLVGRIRDMLREDRSPDVVRALLDVAEALGPAGVPLVAGHLEHDDDSVRRRALVALARCERRFGGDRATRRVEALLEADDIGDRVTGLDAVGALGFARLAGPTLRAAREPVTRAAAAAALARLGEPGLPWIERLLADPDLEDGDLGPIAVQLADVAHAAGIQRLLELSADRSAASAVVAPLRHARRAGRLKPVPRPVMRRVLRTGLADGARYGLLAASFRRTDDGPYMTALREELEGRQRRAGEAVLAALSLGYDPGRVDQLGPHLRAATAAERSNALELLEGLLDPDDRVPVLSFFEGFESADRLRETARATGVAVPRMGADPLESLAQVPDRWLREAALYVRSRVRALAPAGRAGPAAPISFDPHPESEMLPRMEIVFFLKSSPLFRPLQGDELARVASLADTVHLEEDEVLFHQGDPGDAFYMVVTGRVAVEVGTRQVASFGPREGIGEMALLDGQPRSATVRAIEASTLLRIDQAAFEALVDRTPALSKAIYRALSARLRQANVQLQE